MGYFNVPKRDTQIVLLLKQFNNAMMEHGAVLGYDAVQESIVTGAYEAADQSMINVETTKFAARGAVAAKNDAIQEGVGIMRAIAQQIKNNGAATPEIQSAFGISPTPSSSGPVTVPTFLSAEARSNGTCLLSFKRNGNASGTAFIIEFKTTISGNWNFLASITKTRFIDSNAAPGQSRWYRVRAERAGVSTGWSNEAFIYSTGGFSLEIAA